VFALKVRRCSRPPGRLISVSRVRESGVVTLHLVSVQPRLAGDVLPPDGGGGGQALQPIEPLHAGHVLLSALRVQLAPRNLGHPLGGQRATCLLENTKQTTTTTTTYVVCMYTNVYHSIVRC